MRGGGAGRGVAGETCYSAGYGYKGPIVIARASQLRKTLIWTPLLQQCSGVVLQYELHLEMAGTT